MPLAPPFIPLFWQAPCPRSTTPTLCPEPRHVIFHAPQGSHSLSPREPLIPSSQCTQPFFRCSFVLSFGWQSVSSLRSRAPAWLAPACRHSGLNRGVHARSGAPWQCKLEREIEWGGEGGGGTGQDGKQKWNAGHCSRERRQGKWGVHATHGQAASRGSRYGTRGWGDGGPREALGAAARYPEHGHRRVATLLG